MYQRAWPFQFQTGAIKSEKITTVEVLGTFQFQAGAIKSVLQVKVSTEDIQVSIPNWCD